MQRLGGVPQEERAGLHLAGQCATNNCVDGFCCDGPCNGQCQSCKVGGKLGQCQTISGGAVAPRAACTTDGSSCGGACDGINPLACTYPGGGTACGAVGCADTTHQWNADACAGTGSCPVQTSTACNAGYTCKAGACLTTCNADTDCTATFYCDSTHHCAGQKGAGMCNDAAGADCLNAGCRVCTSGFCQLGFCCNATCAASSCGGGQQINNSCATGTCTAGAPMGCSPFTCGATTCNNACTCAAGNCQSANCATGFYCNGTTCLAVDDAHCPAAGNTVVDCAGNANGNKCVAAPSGNFGCGCAADSNCTSSQWCKKGAGAVQAACTAQGTSGMTCPAGTCQVAGCNKCPGGGANGQPCGGGESCP